MLNRRNFLRGGLLSGLAVLLSSFRKWNFLGAGPFPYRILLGRPTTESITIRILPKSDMRVFISYGSPATANEKTTGEVQLFNNVPADFVINNLPARQRNWYRVHHKAGGEEQFSQSHAYYFRTSRAKKENFVFTITADSHLGTAKHCNPALYQQTLDNVARDQPDLHFSLGDDFRASKVNDPDYSRIEQLYYNQIEHLGTLCHSVPFFFVLGNHELEARAFDDGTENCLAAWSTKARKKFIPNPLPGNFYSGNTGSAAGDTLRQNYYSFEWGDVLFVTLDVFWYSNISAADEEMREQQKQQMEGLSKEERQRLREERMKAKEDGRQQKKGDASQPRKDQWNFSIGDEQYQWLRKTLANSKAPYKFVLGHHVMGSCRGGIEWAGSFEWGGTNRKGLDEFSSHRPGWEMPVHQLFVKHGVTAFIQGHDHLFVRQELDGVAYITCPMSGDPGYNTYNSEHYLSGDKLSNTGHLKMMVTENDVQMQYIKAVLPGDEAAEGANGKVAYAWSFSQRRKAE